MAYTEPIAPMQTTVTHNPSDLEIPKTSEILKILSRFIAPVYNTIGKRVTTKEITRNNATRLLVIPSKRFSRYSGIVVKPILRYFGINIRAAITRASADVTSHAMTINPFL